MNSQLIVTQVKRELWENKVSFIYTPAIITTLILIMAIMAAIYSSGKINEPGGHFNFSVTDTQPQAGFHMPDQSSTPEATQDGEKSQKKAFNILSSIAENSDAFNSVVVGIMYANCSMLYLIFFIVLVTYALRCLFDDRKNKDILFWRSLPVSETTNVLVKLSMILLVGPIIMLALNYLTTLIMFLVCLIILVIHGVDFGYLLSSVIKGGAFFVPLQIFYELIFSLLMCLPIIGFAFVASAFAKKTPFFTFISPVLLILADKILDSAFGVNIGVIDALSFYGKALLQVKDAFMLQHLMSFNASMVMPFILCVSVGSLFIVGAIWLRNNRYEI